MTNYYMLVRDWSGWGFNRALDRNFPVGVDPNLYSGEATLPYMVASLVDYVTGSPYIGLNLLYFLSFPIVAVLALACFRIASLRSGLAILLAVSYAFIPFHLGRGLQHIHLALLFGLVTGVLAVLIVGTGLWNHWIEQRSRLNLAKVAGAFALVVITSLSSLYFAAFTAILLFAVILWRWSRNDRLSTLLGQATLLVTLISTTALTLLPVIRARSSVAGGLAVGERDPIDSVTYAGNLLSLIMPAHLPTPLGMTWYTELYAGWLSAVPMNESHLGSSAGTWLTSVCLVVFVISLGLEARQRAPKVISGPKSLAPKDKPSDSPLTMVAFLLISLSAFFVPFGLNFLFANAVTGQIRAWNRLAPALLLLVMIGAAAGLARSNWLRRRDVVLIVTGIGLVAVTWLQVLPFRGIFKFTAVEGSNRLAAAQQYAQAMNELIPRDCGLFTLPYMDYPNNGSVGPAIDDYDPLILLLTNDSKSLSYGGHRDTSEVSLLERFRPPLPDAIPSPQQFSELRQLGYCAVHLDRGGWEDPTAISAQLASQFGAPSLVGRDGQWELYLLR